MILHLKFYDKTTFKHNWTTGEHMVEYTVPHDANMIIVDGIRVSREYFSMLNDDENEGRYFKLKKCSRNNSGLPVIEAVYLKPGYKIKTVEDNNVTTEGK